MKTSIRLIQWIPRIICILAILLTGWFAVGSFGTGLPFWRQVSAFSLHLIPAILLIIFLAVAWKRELVGGAIFLILGLGFIPMVYMMIYQTSHSVLVGLGVVLVINGPLILVGILFILSHFLKRKNPGA